MEKRYADEFRRDAVRMTTTSGLTQPQLSSNLGVGLLTLNNWVQQHQYYKNLEIQGYDGQQSHVQHRAQPAESRLRCGWPEPKWAGDISYI